MSKKILNEPFEDEISITDIFDFVNEYGKRLFATGLLGLLGSVIFLAIIPNSYEANLQIQMAQISSSSSTTAFVNVEEPNLLIKRLKQPTVYSELEFRACDVKKEIYPAESLVELINISAVRGVGNIVELKIRMDSKQEAENCANAIFEKIRESQNQITKPYIETANALIKNYQARLKEAQMLLSKADEAGAAISASYLAIRDEIKFLTEESIRLNTFVTTANIRQAKLLAPIYSSEAPVFPKKKMTLIIGFFLGLFFGLLLVIIRKVYLSYKIGKQ